MDDPDLAALQAELLEVLRTAETPAEARARLRAADLAPDLRAWVESFDLRALEVAMAIAKRWVRVEGS
jgi:hypothetical protein